MFAYLFSLSPRSLEPLTGRCPRDPAAV